MGGCSGGFRTLLRPSVKPFQEGSSEPTSEPPDGTPVSGTLDGSFGGHYVYRDTLGPYPPLFLRVNLLSETGRDSESNRVMFYQKVLTKKDDRSIEGDTQV